LILISNQMQGTTTQEHCFVWRYPGFARSSFW